MIPSAVSGWNKVLELYSNHQQWDIYSNQVYSHHQQWNIDSNQVYSNQVYVCSCALSHPLAAQDPGLDEVNSYQQWETSFSAVLSFPIPQEVPQPFPGFRNSRMSLSSSAELCKDILSCWMDILDLADLSAAKNPNKHLINT